jgi:ankyrin repeat protein
VKEFTDPRAAFLRAATWHGSLKETEPILAAHPELASGDIHTAAVLGDDGAVRRFLEHDPANATARSGPYGADGADALNYLCLSKYLRLDPARSPAFLRAATALLDAGADPNTGFWTTGEFPEFETALYGAAGVAHHPEMTRLLLERGADPNDIEAVYHSPETRDNRAMQLLVETGRVTAENLVLMLIRKHDWHDYDGVKYLLEHGADPSRHRPGQQPRDHRPPARPRRRPGATHGRRLRGRESGAQRTRRPARAVQAARYRTRPSRRRSAHRRVRHSRR